MKVVLDTTIYISWIRERKYADLLMDVHTQKYLSSYVLMELWAGARTKHAGRIVEKLQRPYLKANRIVEPNREHFITVGQVLSDLPEAQGARKKSAGFVNDIFIGLNALSIGATLYTMNKSDFELIVPHLPGLRVTFL